MNYKYTILCTIVNIVLFWIVIKYGVNVIKKYCYCLKEGLTDFEMYSQKIVPYPRDALINYSNVNSPLYSHNVNLPINDPVSCKNFCGPNAKCLLTGEQCTSDIDCYGCNPGPSNEKSTCTLKDVMPNDSAGKLGQNLSLQYSSLTTGYNNHNADFAQIYPDSKNAELTMPYQGLDTWTQSFNKGLELYNKKMESAEKHSVSALGFGFESKKQYYEPKYPLSSSLTGQFYETTPPAANATLQNINSLAN